MKTKNNLIKLLLLGISTFISGSIFSQVDAPGQAWQWSIKVKGGYRADGMPVAYLWIPESCTKVRGIVIGQNNMEELSVLENQQFRDSLESIGFGEIWVSPAFAQDFNAMNGAKQVLEQMLKDLADVSGYPEIFYAPLVPFGHSAMANFGFAVLAACPERALCGISISAIFPYDFGNAYAVNTQCGSTIDFVPYLVCQGEMEGAGDLSNSIFNKSFYKRAGHPYTPITHLPAAGEWHFATSQKKTNFMAYYIKKAVHYRLAADATGSSFAQFTPIDPTKTGWLYDRWIKNMRPRYATAPVGTYKGTKALTGTVGEENFWAFDEDMARRIEAYQSSYFRKTPCLIAYNQSSTAGVIGPQVPQNNNHVQVRLAFTPLNDSLDFELSSSFLDVIPAVSGRCANFMGTTDTITGSWILGTVGASIGYPSDYSLSVIDRELGPVAKLSKNAATGITTLRLSMERGIGSAVTNYNPIFSVAHPGDATYKASVLQADMWINRYNFNGLVQTITFPQIADVSGILNPIMLNATSSLGMPVQYWIEEGPAKIVGNQIVFTTIPQNAKLPIKVTVGAWQWGRNADLAARNTGTNAPYPGQQIQTAKTVMNTFYITGRLTPQVDLTLSATKLSALLNNITWTSNPEVNVVTYEVQHSIDSINWTNLGMVSAGTLSTPYSVSDNNPLQGLNYYRLKITSQDGSFIYSKSVSVDNTTGINSTLSSQIEIKRVGEKIEIIGFEINTDVDIKIFDVNGKTLLSANQKMTDNGKIITTLPAFVNGIYMVQASTKNQSKTLKFVY